MRFLERLLPKNPVFYYPMDDAFPNGFGASVVYDRSAIPNNLMSASAPNPLWQNVALKPFNNAYFDPTLDSLRSFYSPNKSVKHIFTLASFDGGANFGAAYRGLLSGVDVASLGILVGNLNDVKFFNINNSATGTYVYKKSQVIYPESNQTAPFGKIELLDISFSAGWLLDGLQIGKDRDDDNRKWLGRIGETLGYDRVLSQSENEAVNLYYDLKYGLWRKNNTILNFPTPNLTGIGYARFFADVPDYKKNTVSHEYDDGGKSFNETSDYAPRMWEVEFNCTGFNHAESKSKTDIFDAFYNQARFSGTFNFTDKYGETHPGVRIDDYNRSHSAHKSWSQECKFRLVKLP